MTGMLTSKMSLFRSICHLPYAIRYVRLRRRRLCGTLSPMPAIEPIHAVTYAGGGDVSSRIAPPYDVLDEGPKQALLEGDPHNIVSIDLPVTPPKTVGPDEAYDKAGRTYRDWLEQGVLARRDEPAIYAYEQEYTVDGQTLKRRGLFAGVAAQDFNQPGGVYRHEMTIQGGVDDRSKLMAASAAQFSPVFSVFADPQAHVVGLLGGVFERAPDLHGTTAHDGVVHRCWAVTDPSTIQAIQAFFKDHEVFIADGHHRYTTALNYAKAHPDEPAAQQCLMVLVAAEDPGMIVLPYHRVLYGLKDFEMPKLLAEVVKRTDVGIFRSSFDADQMPALVDRLPHKGMHAMGLYAGGEECYVVNTTERDPLENEFPDKPEVWRQLDVAILQYLLLEGTGAIASGREGAALSYRYTSDLEELKAMVNAEPGGRLGVIMQPTPLEAVMGVSLANEVMPPKSTFFYPKLATGLVINPLR